MGDTFYHSVRKAPNSAVFFTPCSVMGHWYLDYSLKANRHSPGEWPETHQCALLDSSTSGKRHGAGLGAQGREEL